jgi:hypothetical protein
MVPGQFNLIFNWRKFGNFLGDFSPNHFHNIESRGLEKQSVFFLSPYLPSKIIPKITDPSLFRLSLLVKLKMNRAVSK